MNILAICDNGDVLSTIRIVKIVLTIIRIAAPVILILTLSISYMNAVKGSDEDLLSKIKKTVVLKLISAALVFFIPTFVNMIAGLISTEKKDYASCLENATEENIQAAFFSSADDSILRVRLSLNSSDYSLAQTQISKVKDTEKKEKLTELLEYLKPYVDLKRKITSLSNKKNKSKASEIRKEINAIQDDNIKETLTKYLEEVMQGSPLGEEPGIYSKNYSPNTGGSMDYFLFIPENATTNMPLLIYLHGDGSVDNFENLRYGEMAEYVFDSYGKEYPFIFIQPHTNIASWTDGLIPTLLKGLIDEVANEYQCDTEKIMLSGGSRGAMGAWYMANKYGNFFSAFVPISGTGNINAHNFVDLPTKAFSSTDSSDSWNYSNMQSNVNAIRGVGGNATFTGLSGYTHNTILSGAFKKATFDWMVAQ